MPVAEAAPAVVSTGAPEIAAPAIAAPRARSCLTKVAATQHPLMHVAEAVEVGDRSFALGWRDAGSRSESVILALDDRGALVVVPVPVPPADPSVLGGDAGGLMIVSVATRATGKLLRIPFGADGTLKAGTSTALPEVAWGWPATLRSDGVRATLEHALSTAEQGVGSIVNYTIDLATLRVISTSPAPPRVAKDETFGTSTPLPSPGLSNGVRVAHADGVIEVVWDGGSGMTHTPTDSKGMRRYYKDWYFNGGQVRLLRHEHGQWVASDEVPLALANAQGRFHQGYAPIVLRHGLHAAVLLAPEGSGDPAWFQPYLAPC